MAVQERDLGVRYVLEGSVRAAGDRIRVTAQLIDATTRAHVWAERFDRQLAAGPGRGAPRMEVLPESRDVTAPIQRALELAPDDPGVQHAYAAVLGNMGRTADAMTVAMEIDVLLEGLKEGPIVVDAEYKTELASANLQQVVTYCFAVGSREAVLAFPVGHLDALGSYSFAGSGLDRHGITRINLRPDSRASN